jgi:hypothetical protein
MPEHADWLQVHSAQEESAAPTRAGSWLLTGCAELLLGSVTWLRRAPGDLQTVRPTSPFRTALRATTTGPTATRENAKHTTTSAKRTSGQVRQNLCIYTHNVHSTLLCAVIMREGCMFVTAHTNSFTDKGVDECFSSYNTEGNYFGNCGSDGTNFIGCSSRYDWKFLLYC